MMPLSPLYKLISCLLGAVQMCNSEGSRPFEIRPEATDEREVGGAVVCWISGAHEQEGLEL